jgi:hypothetical protein
VAAASRTHDLRHLEVIRRHAVPLASSGGYMRSAAVGRTRGACRQADDRFSPARTRSPDPMQACNCRDSQLRSSPCKGPTTGARRPAPGATGVWQERQFRAGGRDSSTWAGCRATQAGNPDSSTCACHPDLGEALPTNLRPALQPQTIVLEMLCSERQPWTGQTRRAGD